MTPVSLLLLLLLLPSLSLRAHGIAAPRPTYEDRDPVTGRTVVCSRCPPGTYLRASCTETRDSECAPCPQGSFTELWNYIGKCLRCAVCEHYQEVKSECTLERDCQCQCKRGYYLKKTSDMCFRHTACPTGQGAARPGTPEDDTVCEVCSNGTFSDVVSAQLNCSEHTRCSALGQQAALRGSSWHDSVCVDCRALQSNDGAHYLRDILPPFFLHHKLSLRHARRLVKDLPSDGAARRHESSLGLSELNARITSWVESASSVQLRRLPAMLTKAGAPHAGERLQNKLNKIDEFLQHTCALANEVDGL